MTARGLLAESESRYRTLFESVDQGFCVLEILFDEHEEPIDYRFIEYNAAFEKQTGLKDARGKRVRDLIPNLDSFWFTTYGKVAKTGQSIRFEQEAASMDRIFDVYAYRVEERHPHRVGLLFSDITSRKRAQIAYERSVDVSPAILWITEADGYCTYLSRHWYEFTGQTPNEAQGFGWLNAIHPDDRELTGKIYADANAKQKPFYAEYRLRTADGDYRWAIDAGNPRFSEKGQYLGYAGTVFDIHDRITAEHKLRDLQARFEKSATATDLGVWYCDLPFDVLVWNVEVKNHFFLAPDETVTIDTFYERIHPDDRQSTRDAIEESIKSRTPYNTIYRTVHPDDESKIRYIRAVGWTDYNQNGEPIRFDGITLDVTTHRKHLQELEVAKDEAERANRLKSAFLANMSHEIRTPLGAMIGFADLLRDPGLTPTERANYVDVLTRNGEQLSVIINDILDLSKVEAGHLTLEHIELAPNQIAADVLSLLRVKAKEKDLALEYASDPSLPAHVVSDPIRVRQVLLNLVSNAIKFTEFGVVRVRGYGAVDDEGRRRLCFEVSDTGIGIANAHRDRVFEVFVQADGSMTRRFGGTGLGLALARRLARALGGDVTILNSVEGKGTTFLFSFVDQPTKTKSHQPVVDDVRPVAIELKANALEGLHILVVDDASDNRQLLWHILTRQGATVDSAENGLIGYRKALAGKHDIILMDIQMPEVDGYTATQKLRSLGYRKPIIALTAHAMSEVRKKCLNAGCTDHVAKPINPKVLISAIVRHVIAHARPTVNAPLP